MHLITEARRGAPLSTILGTDKGGAALKPNPHVQSPASPDFHVATTQNHAPSDPHVLSAGGERADHTVDQPPTGAAGEVQSAKARQLLSDTDIAHLGDIIVSDTAPSPAAAEKRLRDSRETYLRVGDCCEAAIASKRIADLRCAADDIAGAINELETANKLGEQAAAGTEFLGAVKLQLAELYVAREDYGAAENMITEAYAVCLLHENRRVVTQIVYLAATLRFLQGAFQEANASYEEASRLFRECGETASALKCEENADKARTMLENLARQEQPSPL